MNTLPEAYSGNARNAFWWGMFLFPAIAMQRFFPGVDFLIVGLLLILQERRYTDLFWALPMLVILQEGMGTREFGVVLLWYAAVAALFFLGRWLFDVENFLYVFLLSACLAVCHFAVAFLTSPLYAASLDVHGLLDESARLALLLPLCWAPARFTRRWVYAGDTE